MSSKEHLLNLNTSISTQTIAFHQAVADTLGLHPTDHKCVLFLLNGPQTAGYLARQTGLTTGAITVSLGRLKKAGYINIAADEADNRRRIVSINPRKVQHMLAVFAPLSNAVGLLADEFTDSEQEVVIRYLNAVVTLLTTETNALIDR